MNIEIKYDKVYIPVFPEIILKTAYIDLLILYARRLR